MWVFWSQDFGEDAVGAPGVIAGQGMEDEARGREREASAMVPEAPEHRNIFSINSTVMT